MGMSFQQSWEFICNNYGNYIDTIVNFTLKFCFLGVNSHKRKTAGKTAE